MIYQTHSSLRSKRIYEHLVFFCLFHCLSEMKTHPSIIVEKREGQCYNIKVVIAINTVQPYLSFKYNLIQKVGWCSSIPFFWCWSLVKNISPHKTKREYIPKCAHMISNTFIFEHSITILSHHPSSSFQVATS